MMPMQGAGHRQAHGRRLRITTVCADLVGAKTLREAPPPPRRGDPRPFDPGYGNPGQDARDDGLHGAGGRHVELPAARGEFEAERVAPSSGSGVLRTRPRPSSRWRTPVSVLGCTRRILARAPAVIPGRRPRTRSATRCGPVSPRDACIFFESDWRPWSTAQIRRMKSSTLPSGSVARREVHTPDHRIDIGLTSNEKSARLRQRKGALDVTALPVPSPSARSPPPGSSRLPAPRNRRPRSRPPAPTRPTIVALEPTPAPPPAPPPVAQDVLPSSLDEINRRGYLKDAFFEFDRYAIEPAQRDALAADATWLKAHPTVRARIEGHCDERGTAAYNMALGERRAAAARDYLVSLGVEGRTCRPSPMAGSARSRRPTTSPRGRRTGAPTSS